MQGRKNENPNPQSDSRADGKPLLGSKEREHTDLSEEEYWAKKLEDENYFRQMIRPSGELVYENLVLEGGGVLGAAYAGAIKELEKQGVLSNIKRVGGSSAGAIGSMLLALGNTADDLQKTLLETSFADFLDPSEKNKPWKETFMAGVKGSTKAKMNAFWHAQKQLEKGLFTGNAFIEWEHDQIRKALNKVPGFVESFAEWRGLEAKEDIEQQLGTVTFSELHQFIVAHPECGLRDLYVTASNLDRDRLEVLSHETTPDVPIFIAVRMSMSFPTAFNVVMYDLYNQGYPERFVDGGLFNNYPMHIFDQYQYVPEGLAGVFRRTRCNLGTLGLKVDKADEIARFWNVRTYHRVDDMSMPAKSKDEKADIVKVASASREIALRHYVASFYGKDVLESHQQERVQEERIEMLYPQRTIQIHDAGIASTDFSIDAKRAQVLVENGQRSVAQFFEAHRNELVPESFEHMTFDQEVEERTIEELMEMIKNCRNMIQEAEEHGYEKKYTKHFRRFIVVLQEQVAEKVWQELMLENEREALSKSKGEQAENRQVFLGKGKDEYLQKMKQAHFEKSGIFSPNLGQFTEERIRMMKEIVDVLSYHIDSIYSAKLNICNVNLRFLIEDYNLENNDKIVLPSNKNELYAEEWKLLGDDHRFWTESPVSEKYADIMKEVGEVKEQIKRVSEVRDKLIDQLVMVRGYQRKSSLAPRMSDSRAILFSRQKAEEKKAASPMEEQPAPSSNKKLGGGGSA